MCEMQLYQLLRFCSLLLGDAFYGLIVNVVTVVLAFNRTAVCEGFQIAAKRGLQPMAIDVLFSSNVIYQLARDVLRQRLCSLLMKHHWQLITRLRLQCFRLNCQSAYTTRMS